MTNQFLRILTLVVAFMIAACTGPQSEDNATLDDVVSEMDEVVSDGDTASGEESLEDELDDFGSDEEVATSQAEPQINDQAANEGFSEEEQFSEESFDEEQFGEEIAETQPPAETEIPQGLDEPITEEAVGDSAEMFDMPADDGSGIIGNQVTAINYLSSTNGGTVEIKTESPATFKTRINEENNQFVIELQGTLLPEALKRPYIMKDFEGQFAAINAYQNAGSTTARIVVELRTPGEPTVTQEGSVLLVLPSGPGVAVPVQATTPTEPPKNTDEDSFDVAAAAQSEKMLGARNLEEFLSGSERFFGRPISIQTNDADIRDIINFVSEESGLNIVISEAVKGRISVKLRQVPWDQALVIVMKSNGLGYTRQGNVVRITTLKELEDESSAAKRIVDTQKNLVPLKVKVIPVSYANVNDLSAQLKPFLTKDRGQIVFDERTTSLIITDTADVLERLDRLVRELDIPPAQVMIEGKIVEAAESFSRRIGVNFFSTGSPVEISSGGGVNNSALNLTSSFNSAPIPGQLLEQSVGTLNVNVGVMDFFGSLEARLGLAQNDQLVRIISSPRIVTMNKTSAQIEQKGQVVSIVITVDRDGNPARSIVRNDVVLNLTVTPQVTSEGSVVLDVDVKREFPGAIVDTDTQARPINSRSAKTKVLVPNGQTAVLGGIYQSDETDAETGIPGLKNIPVLGWLFKSKTSEKTKNELLIFLTPRILNAKDQTGEA